MMKKSLLLAPLMALTFAISAQTVDPSFQGFITGDSDAQGAILLDDGKFLVYGFFKRIGNKSSAGVAMFNADGTLDETFAIGTGANNNVLAAAIQPNGQIVLGGRFTSFNGVNRTGLIRLNADGSVDNTFAPSLTIKASNLDFNIAVQADGKVLFNGAIDKVEGITQPGIPLVRFNTDGSYDNTFSPPVFDNYIYDIEIQADGKIMVAGEFSGRFLRLNDDGSIDPTFDIGTGFNNRIKDIEIASSGQIYVGGDFTQFQGGANRALVRLNDDGSLDATYGGNGTPSNGIDMMSLHDDGKLMVVGVFSSIGGTFVQQPARLAADGTLDNTFDVGGGSNSFHHLVSSNSSGEVLSGGFFTAFDGQPRNRLVILNEDGSVKPLTEAPSLQAGDIAIHVEAQGSDKILVSHQAKFFNGVASQGLERINLDGTIDATFGGSSKPNNAVGPILTDHNNMIIIGGQFTSYNGTAAVRIARLSPEGVLDTDFATNTGTGFQSTTFALTEQPDGKILVGGAFTTFNATPQRALARLNEDGTLDATFNSLNGFATSTATPTAVRDIEVLPDGKILVAGEFNSFDNHPVLNLVRLNADGSFDDSFLIGTGVYRQGTGAVSAVYTVEAMSNGKLLVGGSFDRVNDVFQPYMTVLNSDGTLDATHELTGFFIVEQIAEQANGKFVVLDRNTGMRRLNADGTIDHSFEPVFIDHSSTDVATVGTSMIVSGFLAIAEDHTALGLAKVDLPATLPDAPSTLATTGFTQTTVSLSWTAPGTNETGFSIERSSPDNTNFEVVGWADVGTTTFQDTGLSPSTLYYYRVSAANASGNSAYSNEVSLTTQMSAPAAPSDLVLTVIDAGAIKIDWTDNSDNESGFQVYRSLSDNSNYALLTTLDPDITTYTDLTVTQGVTTYYKVRSTNAGGSSAYSNEVNGFPLDPAPAWPHNLQAIAIGVSQIDLTWSDNSDNETGFEIERAVAGSVYELIHTTGPDVTTYSDLTVEHSVTYYYQIRAINGPYKSGYTNEAFATPQPPGPDAPTGLVLSSPSPTEINLLWTDQSDDEDEFVIERSVNSVVNFAELVVLPANTTTYHDTGLTPGNAYYYRVRARNEIGTSMYTQALLFPGVYNMSGTTITACQGYFLDAGGSGAYSNNTAYTMIIQPESAGSSVRVTFNEFNTAIGDKLSIYDGTSTAASLVGVYEGTASPGTVTATTGSGALTFVFESNASGVSSGWHSTISCGMFTSTPGGLELEPVNTTELLISWDDVQNETGYVVDRAVGTSGTFTTIASLPANTVSYHDNTVVTNTTYTYKIRATATDGDSEYSAPQSIAFGNGGIWRSRKDLDATQRTDAVGFGFGSHGFIGLGWAGGAQSNSFRVYDTQRDSWKAIASFGGLVRSEASAFVLEGHGCYVGLGEWFDPEKDLWLYDTAANTWTQKADFGGTARTGAVGFSVAGKGYFGLGVDDGGYTNDVWQYDPVANTWTEVAPFPGPARNGAVAFVIGDFAYVGSGYDGASRRNDFYRYDPAANTWTEIGSFPGIARRLAVAFALDGKGYFGTGDAGSDQKDFWVYDPATDIWELIVSFGGTARFAATAFAVDGKGYVGTGFDGSERKDLWQFTPATIAAPPLAPGNLTATAISSSQIDLAWTDNSGNETGFILERSTVSESTGWEMLAVTSPNATAFSDTGLQPATIYYYRVKATTTGAGSSTYSQVASAATLPEPPDAPTNLDLVIGSGSEVVLTWDDNSTNETGFTIERSPEDNNDFEVIAAVDANTTTYTDTGVGYEVTAFYRVRATNDGGASAYSNEKSIYTGDAPIAAPTSLTAQALSSASIRLTWTDNSGNEDRFTIVRSTQPLTGFVGIASVPANTVEYTDDDGLSENTTYYYKVRAETDLPSESGYSNVASATTLISIPVAPQNLTAEYNEDDGSIFLNWTDLSDNEDNFIIERSFNGTTFTHLADVADPIYTDADPGTTFQVFYRVAAENSGGISAFTNTAQVVITGIEKGNGLSGVNTYPNPVVDQLNIEFTSAYRGSIAISFFDLTGRQLMRHAFYKSTAVFAEQVSAKPLGGNAIVMMKVVEGERVVIRKVAVK